MRPLETSHILRPKKKKSSSSSSSSFNSLVDLYWWRTIHYTWLPMNTSCPHQFFSPFLAFNFAAGSGRRRLRQLPARMRRVRRLRRAARPTSSAPRLRRSWRPPWACWRWCWWARPRCSGRGPAGSPRRSCGASSSSTWSSGRRGKKKSQKFRIEKSQKNLNYSTVVVLLYVLEFFMFSLFKSQFASVKFLSQQ